MKATITKTACLALALGLSTFAAPVIASADDNNGANNSYECPKHYAAGPGLLTIEAGIPLVVALSSPPPARVRLSLDRTDGKEHREIEWDPDIAGPVVRRVTLAGTEYKASFWVQPIILNQTTTDDKINSHHININLNCFKKPEKEKPGKEKSNRNKLLIAKSTAFKPLNNKPVALPPLTVEFTQDTKATREQGLGLEFAPLPAQESLRGLSDPIPETVDRVLRLIAEIAVERAKSQGLHVLKRHITKRLCTDFNWKTVKLSEDDETPILPQTCALIENMRLMDIASAGRPLLSSLQGDLKHSVLPTLLTAALKKNKYTETLAPLASRTINLAAAIAERDPRAARMAQMLLAEISHLAWNELAEHSRPLACGTRLMVEVAKTCVNRGTCSATDIVAMVTRPDEYLASAVDSDYCKGTHQQLRAYWPELDLIAERAVFLVSPPRQTTATDMARAAVDVTFAIADKLCAEADSGCQPGVVTKLRGVIEALIDRDLTLTMSRAALLIRTLAPEAKKIAGALQLISAFSSYAAIEEGDDAEALESARKARKKAIETLIDSATDRSERAEEWVVSIGANPGLFFGGQWLTGPSGAWSTDVGRLTLPFGIAIQRLPKEHFGFHAMLGIADLAQYIPGSAEIEGESGAETIQDSVRWDDFVAANLQLGVIIGGPTLPFVVGVEGQWSPSLFARDVRGSEERGAWRVGAFVSYYVPFFDLN